MSSWRRRPTLRELATLWVRPLASTALVALVLLVQAAAGAHAIEHLSDGDVGDGECAVCRVVDQTETPIASSLAQAFEAPDLSRDLLFDHETSPTPAPSTGELARGPPNSL